MALRPEVPRTTMALGQSLRNGGRTALCQSFQMEDNGWRTTAHGPKSEEVNEGWRLLLDVRRRMEGVQWRQAKV